MASLFLAPHSDDEALFGAFTIMRERPVVVVCSDCGSEREAETRAAMRILDAPLMQWQFGEFNPTWAADVEEAIRAMPVGNWERVYAPFPRADGNWQHNHVGDVTRRHFDRRTVFYLTYTSAGKDTDGEPVPYTPDMVLRKLQALACYRSQVTHPSHAPHFVRDQTEYLRGVPSSL